MTTQKLSDKARKVWENEFGDEQEGYDCEGNYIVKAAYADHDSDNGWNIDHIKPKSLGGTDGYYNLRPMAIFANSERGNDYDEDEDDSPSLISSIFSIFGF